MKTAGIICECNPLHGGHLYLLEQARASGADAVVAVMSGCFVQRGEAAVADPYARAEILVRAGFDAVVELPFPFAAASAEFFGAAGVEILSRLGVDELWFGSECGDVQALSRCAEIADSDAFAARYNANVQRADGTARAYFDVLREMCADAAVTFDPNDILAISYLRALCKTDSKMQPVTVKRRGSGYAQQTLTDAEFPSATALRHAWRERGLDAITPYLPAPCAEILAREAASGRAPADMRAIDALTLGHFRMCDPASLESVAELGGGLGNRMAQLSHRATTAEELMALCATKKYTDARLRRGALFALARVGERDLRGEIAYVRLLAANRTGCAFLAQIRKSATIPVVTRQTDVPETAAARAQLALESRARDLYAMTLPTRESGEVLMRRTPVITE
ncbi:MAG: nucleotidyltransferase family protein [Clostridia bacterium]|nr:nucleotidyltransferase family protein [Clostridia bacterium]